MKIFQQIYFMTFETIHKSSAPEKVVEQILQKINAGELQPGSRLPSQKELAQKMGVGRSSMREAINALVVMGYLEAIHGKGTFIRQTLPAAGFSSEGLRAALTAGSIFDLMEARQVLECKSAKLAAERAEPAQIKKLKKVLKKVKATEKDDTIFLQADIDFHACLAYRLFSIHSANKVVNHIENGEGEKASAWMARHLKAINDELKSIIT
jgi:GntR family transcriptional repressor for pyruvate dehydrogenase complex